MRLISLSCAGMIVILSLLVSCGGGGGGDTSCTPNGNLSLHSSSTSTALLTGLTITATRSTAVTPVSVFIRYASPPVAAILAGYPPGGTDPRTVGINIAQASPSTNNPVQFSLSFVTTGATATYSAMWRFVAIDASPKPVGCQDLPVTFAIN